jgi:hypothetical protein
MVDQSEETRVEHVEMLVCPEMLGAIGWVGVTYEGKFPVMGIMRHCQSKGRQRGSERTKYSNEQCEAPLSLF